MFIMRTLSQFLEDFVYTTDQNKTDAHVKQIVKPFIKNAQVDLADNGCNVTGELAADLRKFVATNATNEGIAVTSEITTKLKQILDQFLQSMLDQRYVNLKFEQTESKAYPATGGNQTKMINCDYNFVCDQFLGQGTITVDRIGKPDASDTDYNAFKYHLTINASWSEL